MPTDERERLVAELKRAIAFMVEPGARVRRTGMTSSLGSVTTKPQAAEKRAGEKKTPTPRGGDPSRLRSISFTPALLDAVLAGGKTQTRRPIRPAPINVTDGVAIDDAGGTIPPLFDVGERVWVREKWARITVDGTERFVYESDHGERARWISSRYMPRDAARRFLLISRIEAVQLASIDPEAARAEGMGLSIDPVGAFLTLWDSIYGETEFAARNDPWVWAVHFRLERVNDLSQ
jgi:hypothetical protein